MVLKVKELDYKCLILRISRGIYDIEIHETKARQRLQGELIAYSEIEVLETYDSCDYSLEEVCAKLDKIYDLLKS